MSEHNIIFVTLDSCRYDTAMRAPTPNLDSLGPMHRAETHSTFTLPAHHGFFGGFLPRVLRPDGEPRLFGSFQRLWRPLLGLGSGTVAMPFDGPTVLGYAAANGYRVLGYGGMPFFDPSLPANSLPRLFPAFAPFTERGRGARSEHNHPFLAVGAIADEIARRNAPPLLLFINTPETHIPYTLPNDPVGGTAERLGVRLDVLAKAKSSGTLPGGHLSTGERDDLLLAQVRAVEWIDERLGEVIAAARASNRSTYILVCGDHGDELGENGRYGHGHVHQTVLWVPLWGGEICV